MKNISLFVIVDNIFKFVLIFIINLIWLLYFIQNSVICFTIAATASLIELALINFYSNKKQIKAASFLKEEQKIIDITNTFLVMNNYELINFFYNLALKKHKCLKFANYIKVISSGKPIIIFPHFKKSEFNEDDFLTAYKQFKTQQIKRLIILTNKTSFSVNNLNLKLNFEVLVLNHKNIYFNLLKEYEFYPEIMVKTKPKVKHTFKQILSHALNKKKTKAYFFSALFILFSSLFVKAKIYYLLTASLLLFMALFAWFNPTFNHIEKHRILD